MSPAEHGAEHLTLCSLRVNSNQRGASRDNADSVNEKVKVGMKLHCNYGTGANMLLEGSDLISCFVNSSLTLNTFISN